MPAKKDRVITANEESEDRQLDQTLRPKALREFVGQNKVKDNLTVFMAAAKKRKEPIEHVLLHGPPGIGKTTLAHIIAGEMRVNVRVTSGPAIERAGDLGAILTNLEDGDILFIDEIHRLHRTIEEVLYPAMEDYVLDIVVGKGPSARTLRLDLPKFTLVGATTRVHLLSSPLRDRFGTIYRLDFYEHDDIEKIIKRSADILKVKIDQEARSEVAKRARRTPRVANRLLKRVRDYAQVKSDGTVTSRVANEALSQLDIDHQGLDNIDRRILTTIIEKFGGGPVGLNTIAASISEDQSTLEEVYEPYLMQAGFLARTSRGRVVTESGYKHLGKEAPADLQGKLV
ncbi:Holliday junction branch migration DNA helicase RuvB [Patescibacteria group bacterium]|nr:Holliday junction branch migration DNA helicase RuvB [Patescibacteria group bacterium]MBU0963866.1 Holliday junction branch migration DNA helicase RuvB [Patescibacteria group bacterium]